MAHLNDEQLLDLARISEDSVPGAHILECEECRQGLEMWRLAIEHLPAVFGESVGDSESHHLRVMFRQHGPKEASVVRWVASLVRSSADTVEASVRGSSAADLFEYQAGPFTMMLESGPLHLGSYPVHGQVFHSDDGELAGIKVVIAADDGPAFVETLDEFGEFHIEVTIPGRYRATVCAHEGVFSVPDLRVGGSSGG